MDNRYKRREFLENVCPQVALAMFGVTLVEACSKGDDDDGYSGSSDSAISVKSCCGCGSSLGIARATALQPQQQFLGKLLNSYPFFMLK